MKEIDLAGAIARIKDGSEQVCMIVPIGKSTTLEEIFQAHGYVLAEPKKEPAQDEDKPKKAAPKPKVDHGKIMALHKAGWNASAIALEVGCSAQTVLNHINAEKANGQTD